MSESPPPPQRRSADAQRGAVAPLRWPLEALWAQLEPLRPGLTVERLIETDSTNTRLLERARSGDATPCLLVAERQTAGRGRLGRAWVSDTSVAPGPDGPASLTFSLGMAYAPADWSGLSLAVGVALAEALHAGVRLKWPNDLWLVEAGGAGRKLGGVLIETVALPDDGGRYMVAGIGINLETPAPHPDIGLPAAGWREFDAHARAPDLLARLAGPLLQAVIAFEHQGFDAFTSRFAARDALAGQRVATSQPDLPEGVADGVDGQGALRILTPAGLRLVSSGEVSVRPC